MIAVVQRSGPAHVDVAGEVVGRIEAGFVVLLGVRRGDTAEDAAILARKIAGLRVLPDAEGRMNVSLKDAGGAALVISQFTLCADLAKGRRPGFDGAEEPGRARLLLGTFVEDLVREGVRVEQGRFGASMAVHLVNMGPATFILDSGTWRKPVDSGS